MRIVKLQAENLKRLRAVEIEPSGNLVVIGGKNGQGKTSLLDSMMICLAGERAIPAKPVRDGEKEAKITIELDEDFVIERRIKPSGESTLHVRTKNGAKYPSPQTLLDGFSARFTFDPLAFKSMKPKEQAELLKGILGLDFSLLDQVRQETFNMRTELNRRVRELESRLKVSPHHPEAPAEEVSIEEISGKIEAVREQEIALAEKISDERALFARLGQADRRKKDLGERIERLKNEITELRADSAEIDLEIGQIQKARTELRETINSTPIPDAADLQAQLLFANETNRQVRENSARDAQERDLAQRNEQADELTAEIEDIDAKKAKQLAEAHFPIDGLSFDENGVLFGGIPFAQISAAEQLRVSMAMGIALHPRLKVLLIRDGSLLDEDNLRLVAELAEEHGAQVWLERVGAGEEVAVVLEDGSVKEDRPKAKKAKVGK